MWADVSCKYGNLGTNLFWRHVEAHAANLLDLILDPNLAILYIVSAAERSGALYYNCSIIEYRGDICVVSHWNTNDVFCIFHMLYTNVVPVVVNNTISWKNVLHIHITHNNRTIHNTNIYNNHLKYTDRVCNYKRPPFTWITSRTSLKIRESQIKSYIRTEQLRGSIAMSEKKLHFLQVSRQRWGGARVKIGFQSAKIRWKLCINKSMKCWKKNQWMAITYINYHYWSAEQI